MGPERGGATLTGLSVADVMRRLETYKRAWEERDSDTVVTLFAEDAHYIETPFRTAMIGHDAIRRYWDAEVVTAQPRSSATP